MKSVYNGELIERDRIRIRSQREMNVCMSLETFGEFSTTEKFGRSFK